MRRLQEKDREVYIQMVQEFYCTEAVAHKIPLEHIEHTFEELMTSDVYAEGYIIESEGKAAGYLLLAKTFSQEAGGMVIWIEELYIRPEFQSKGLGSQVLTMLDEQLKDRIYRLRLEVEKANIRAAELYERQGYIRLGYEQLIKDK